MSSPTVTPFDDPLGTPTAGRATAVHHQANAVAWGAIVAGAAAAAALSLILLVLGTGLGLSALSPWVQSGPSAMTLGVSTIIWLTLTQVVAAGTGGYLAGRLRTRWIDVEDDEVYFRDTAHGFLAWAVASLATAALLSSAIGAIVGGGIQAGAAVAGDIATSASAGLAAAGSGTATPAGDEGRLSYFVDYLSRQDGPAAAAGASAGATAGANTPVDAAAPPAGAPSPAAGRPLDASEVRNIFINTLRTGALPADDLHYLGRLVAQRSGLAQREAEKRVGDAYARAQASLRDAETAAREAAEKARKASAYTALWLFISLLIGAFIASLAATYGGRLRDA